MANRRILAARGLKSLPVGVARRFGELARQPLLLLMLALYDATGNALQNTDSSFGTVQLYERLLGDFARREVRRWHDDAPEDEIDVLAEDELMRLSIVAFAMFNRGRQWVTGQELDSDLAALGMAAARTHRVEGFRSSLTPGQEVVGRFFFIQRAQATQEGRILQTYEFLHATFGEYLIARLIVDLVRENALLASSRTARLRPATRDDELLQSLLWHMALSLRANILTYVEELLVPHRATIRPWLVDRLRTAVPSYSYVPRADIVDHWVALYSLNLTLLVLACGEGLRGSELWPDADDPADQLRYVAVAWRSGIHASSWLDMMSTFSVRRTWVGRRRDIEFTSAFERPAAVDPFWTHRLPPGGREVTTFGFDFVWDRAITSMNLTNGMSEDVLRHVAEPLIERMPFAITNFGVLEDGSSESVAHSLVRLLVASAAGDDDLVDIFDRAVEVACARMTGDGDRRYLLEKTTLILVRAMERDRKLLGSKRIFEWLSKIVSAGPADEALSYAITHCMSAGGSDTEARWLRSRMETV